MNTQNATLAGFLLARIAEDQEVAEAETDWSVDHGVLLSEVGQGYDMVRVRTVSRHRLLAECQAKRSMVQLHRSTVRVMGGFGERAERRQMCTECSVAEWPCVTLRLLALPYAGHPDYRPEWAP